jgi:hypothetical protein
MATTRRKDRTAPSSPRRNPVKHPNADLVAEGSRPCPICSKAMETQRRRDAAIDVCADHGIWLDRQELERMLLLRAKAAGARIRKARAEARLARLYWMLWL